MATLFNTKIKDTYQSLLKLEDNTILTTTSKNITDGLGNASPLYLSTTQVRIGSNSGSAMYWDNTNNRLGIGTNAPTEALTISGNINFLGSNRTIASSSTPLNAIYSDSLLTCRFIRDSGGQGILFTDTGGSAYAKMGFGNLNTTIGQSSVGVVPDLGARLGIRGAGSTSATTSLLVQNSGGTESLKVQDDNIVRTTYLGIGGGTSTNNIGGTHIAQFGNAVSAGDQIIVVDSVSGSKRGFKFGNQGTIRMALIQDGVNLQIGNYVNPSAFVPYTTFDYLTGNVGIGTTTPTSKLHVSGGDITIQSGNKIQNESLQGLYLTGGSGEFRFINGGGGGWWYTWYQQNAERMRLNTSNQLCINNTTGGGMLTIQGSGSTSATSSLLVQNSAGTQILKVQDDGQVFVNQGNQQVTFTGAGGISRIQAPNEMTIGLGASFNAMKVYYDGRVGLQNDAVYISSGNVGIGTTNPAFKTQISSSGTSTSISTIASSNYNLVVQNTTDVAGTYSGIGFMNPYDTQGYIGVSQITTGFGAGGNMLFALRPSLGGAVMTEYMRLLHNGNLLIGTTTDSGFKLNVNGSINITGGNKLNFNNGSSQCWITTAGGATGPSSRSISLPGTGGGGDFIFYNDGPYGIRITESGGDTLIMSPGNSSVTGIMGINKSAASGYGGGTFIYYQTTYGNRMYTFGNPNNERADEGGSHTKIAGGAAGFLGNGGHVYLEAGAKGTQVGSVDGNIIIAATRGNVAIGLTTPTARLQVQGSGSTSATTALLVQDSGSSQLFKIADNGWTTINSRLYLLGDTIYNSSSQPALGVGGTMYMQSNTGIDFSWQNLVQGRFSFTSNVNTNNSVGSPKNSLYTSHTINDGAASSLTEFRSMAVLDTMNMTTFPLTTFIGLFISPTIVSSTTKVRAIQSTIGGAYFNTSSVNASAVLQADSTTQGFLPPRVTTIQKNAIATPAEGLMVYDTDLKRPCFFNGTSWITL